MKNRFWIHVAFFSLTGLLSSGLDVPAAELKRNAETAIPDGINKAGPSKGTRPNILVITTDDESWLERSVYGWSNIPSPNLERLADSGVLFTRGYTSAPSCAPSRASLLSGRNFWELGAGAFIQAWVPDEIILYPELFEEAGYHVGATGKPWGPGIYPERIGHQRDMVGTIYRDIVFEDRPGWLYPIDYAANFEAFLDDRPEGGAFCFWAGIFEPHAPFGEDSWRRLEEEFGIALEDIPMPGFMPDTPGVRKERANFLYEVAIADQELGRILEVLEKRGLRENTLIFFAGDNGTYLSIPRGKATPYDWSTHVPMAISWPARVPGGRTVTDFVNFADVAPTLLEAAGLEIPHEMSGRSLLDVLVSGKSGQVDPSRDFVVTGLEWHGEMPPYSRAHRTIREGDWTYIINYGKQPHWPIDEARAEPLTNFEEVVADADVSELLNAFPEYPDFRPFAAIYSTQPPPEELYNLADDPWQMHNLAYDSRHEAVKKRLRERMLDYLQATGDPRATGEPETFEKVRAFVIERKRAGYPMDMRPQFQP